MAQGFTKQIIARPSFKARKTTNLTVTTGTWTKIDFETETFDTNGDYDSATNFRHTPTLAGKYLYTSSILFVTPGDGKTVQINYYKNGVADIEATEVVGNGSAWPYITISALVDMDGSTDYIELYGKHDKGSDNDIRGHATKHTSYFSGVRVGD